MTGMESPPDARRDKCEIISLEANVDPLDRGVSEYRAAIALCKVPGCGKDGTCQFPKRGFRGRR